MNRRPAIRYLVVLLLMSVGVGFAALGVWQLERLRWKLDLIQRVETRIHAAPVAAPDRATWRAINVAGEVYRRVAVEGRLLHDRETLVQAVTEQGPGFWVLTPLERADGSVILVNRGFVPQSRRDPASRPEGHVAGMVRLTGLLRATEPKGGFLRHNDPASDRWYSRDVAAIAAARHVADAAPFFIDADKTPNAGGWPLGGLTVVAFSNNHLVYALTWFVLAIMSGGATLLVIRQDWSSRRDGLQSRAHGRLMDAVGQR